MSPGGSEVQSIILFGSHEDPSIITWNKRNSAISLVAATMAAPKLIQRFDHFL